MMAPREQRMQGKITLEDHFATEETLGDSQPFGAHVWSELRYRLLDFREQRLRLMDQSGVEIMVISLNAPAVQAIPTATTG
jgi:gamma-resorcylate decarboxylase